MFYVFGAILLLSALRMLRGGEEPHDVGNSFPARLVRRFVPVTPELERARFFVRREGRLFATPLFVALVMVELTDVVFAVDSIPAILAVTRDPFLVFTFNAFAILGPALAVLRRGGPDGDVPLPALQPGADPGVRRHEDAAGVDLPRVRTWSRSGSSWARSGAGILASIWATRRDAANGGDGPAA